MFAKIAHSLRRVLTSTNGSSNTLRPKKLLSNRHTSRNSVLRWRLLALWLRALGPSVPLNTRSRARRRPRHGETLAFGVDTYNHLSCLSAGCTLDPRRNPRVFHFQTLLTGCRHPSRDLLLTLVWRFALPFPWVPRAVTKVLTSAISRVISTISLTTISLSFRTFLVTTLSSPCRGTAFRVELASLLSFLLAGSQFCGLETSILVPTFPPTTTRKLSPPRLPRVRAPWNHVLATMMLHFRTAALLADLTRIVVCIVRSHRTLPRARYPRWTPIAPLVHSLRHVLFLRFFVSRLVHTKATLLTGPALLFPAVFPFSSTPRLTGTFPTLRQSPMSSGCFSKRYRCTLRRWTSSVGVGGSSLNSTPRPGPRR
jgi:hypothetical protein